MRKKIDLLGQKFGKLTVIKELDERSKRGMVMWLCQCDCGNYVKHTCNDLRSGKSKSCGCSQNMGHPTHGKCDTRIYEIWASMKKRCLNKNCQSYDNYGGRGIIICDEWLKFENFYTWAIENGYNDNLTLDRVNNNLGYNPNNCRWANRYTQANNKRNNVLITYNGKTQTLPQWCRELNLPYATIWDRVQKGWTDEEILTTPIKKITPHKKYILEYNGKSQTIAEWSKELNINSDTIRQRIKRGWSIERICNEATHNNANSLKDDYNITYENKTQNLKQWCEELNLPYGTIWARIKAGWSYEKALSMPLCKTGKNAKYK